jgi:hypothetical protein
MTPAVSGFERNHKPGKHCGLGDLQGWCSDEP